MRYFGSAVLAILLGLLLTPLTGYGQRVVANHENTAAMSNRILKSVAIIKTYTQSNEPLAQGSGFAIAPDIVITNLHVFKGAFGASVKFTGKASEQKITEVLGFDLTNDLCAVRVANGNATPLFLNTRRPLQITEEVFAFGNPKGLEGTVSKGIVSSLRRANGLVQIDAAISPGSSGGPITNNRGEVVGVVVSTIANGQNLNFAVPAERITSLEQSNRYELLVAGSMAVSDREADGLHGPVIGYVESYVDYLSDSKNRVVALRIKYNDFGNLTHRTMFSWTSGEWLSTEINKYDENGSLIRQEYKNSDGQEKITVFSRMDAISKRISERRFSNVRTERDARVTYDSLGHEIERVYDGEDAYTSQPYKLRYVNRFGAGGFVSESLAYRDRGGKKASTAESIHTHRYKYDSARNWVERIDEILVLLPPQPRDPLTTRAVYRAYEYHTDRRP